MRIREQCLGLWKAPLLLLGYFQFLQAHVLPLFSFGVHSCCVCFSPCLCALYDSLE